MRKLMLGNTKLMVVDDLSPEDVAMLQALYSRSAESAEVHVEKIRAAGSGKFMKSYYVGYNHKSIADCGDTTMFIEDVSLLVAKAIQDWPLYSGQETSTRYIDMSRRRIVDPVGTARSAAILERWMNFYTSSQELIAAHIRQRYPRKPEEREDAYEGAVKARTFDTLRGFLPAGITTQLSWHTNLRQAGDHLIGLTRHPVQEVRDLGAALRQLLEQQYPSSGFDRSLAGVSGVANQSSSKDAAAREAWERQVAAREVWEQQVANEMTYATTSITPSNVYMRTTIEEWEDTACDMTALRTLLATRPRGCVLPHSLTRLGQIHYHFGLDFGSFRDLQRHRNGVVVMPLLTLEHGFEEWYFRELGLLEQAGRDLVALQTKEIGEITADPFERQFYIGLGFIVPCWVTLALPAAIYMMELRSTKFIHPTLRTRVLRMVELFRAQYPTIALHIDSDPDDWTVRRGLQTITAKAAV